MNGPGSITTVISDFGGVLTTPLVQSFAAVQDHTGVPFEELAKAMARIEQEDGAHPLYELEKGNLTEVDFLQKLGDALEPALGHRPELHRFREIYFDALHPNEPMIELMREAKSSGRRMGMLTNNVREWESLWRAMLPVDEIFEVVVDSGFVGMRKPDREIYELTLERLEGVPAEECLFIDDVDVNCAAARKLGMSTVHYRNNDQAIPEIREALVAGCLVVGAVAIPHVELHRLPAELYHAGWREPLQHQVQGALLGDPLLEGLLAPEAGGELEGLAAVVPERVERPHQEVAIGDGLPHLHRAVPGCQHRDVVLVELRDRFGVVLLELLVRDFVDPGTDSLSEQLAAGLTAYRIGDRPDGVGWVYEAKCHLGASVSTLEV